MTRRGLDSKAFLNSVSHLIRETLGPVWICAKLVSIDPEMMVFRLEDEEVYFYFEKKDETTRILSAMVHRTPKSSKPQHFRKEKFIDSLKRIEDYVSRL